MTLQLRPYQRAAIDAIYAYFTVETGHPLVVIPTAGGKSLVMAAFIQEVLARWANERIIILTHVRELISQNLSELIRLWPEAPAGIYSAGLNRRDVQAQILFAGIQSVHRKAYTIQRETKSWLWPAFTFMYMTVLAYVGAFLTFQIGKLIVG